MQLATIGRGPELPVPGDRRATRDNSSALFGTRRSPRMRPIASPANCPMFTSASALDCHAGKKTAAPGAVGNARVRQHAGYGLHQEPPVEAKTREPITVEWMRCPSFHPLRQHLAEVGKHQVAANAPSSLLAFLSAATDHTGLSRYQRKSGFACPQLSQARGILALRW